MKISPINNITYQNKIVQNRKSEDISFGKLSDDKKDNLKIAAWYLNAISMGIIGSYGIICAIDDKIDQQKSTNTEKVESKNSTAAPDTVCCRVYMMDPLNPDSVVKIKTYPNPIQLDSIVNDIEQNMIAKNNDSKKDLAKLKSLKQDYSEKSRKLDSLSAVLDKASADIDKELLALNKEASVHEKTNGTVSQTTKYLSSKTLSAKTSGRKATPVKRTQKVKTVANKNIIKLSQIVLVVDRPFLNRHRADLMNVYLRDNKDNVLNTKAYIRLVQSQSPRVYQTSIVDKKSKKPLLELESYFDYSSTLKSSYRGFRKKHSGDARHLYTSITYKAKNVDINNVEIGVAE